MASKFYIVLWVIVSMPCRNLYSDSKKDVCVICTYVVWYTQDKYVVHVFEKMQTTEFYNEFIIKITSFEQHGHGSLPLDTFVSSYHKAHSSELALTGMCILNDGAFLIGNQFILLFKDNLC